MEEAARRGLRLPSSVEVLNLEIPPAWFHEGHLEAWKCNFPDEVLLAGTQGGKTCYQGPWLAREIQRCARLIDRLGSGKFLYVGPTLTLLQSQALPEFQEYFEEELKLGRLTVGNKPKFTFSEQGKRKLGINPERSVTVHFAYANDSSNLESMTALAGVWDETGQKENKQASFRAFNRRLKVARSLGYGRRLFGTTPYEWGWFKADVIDKINSGRMPGKVINFPSWMNPLISRAECEKEKDNMPLWQWNMMYLGQYERPLGAIYDCFDRERNTHGRFEIPDEWPRVIGVDFGNVNTAVVFLAQEIARDRFGYDNPTGRWFLYRSYHGGHKDGRKACKEHVPRLLNRHGEVPEYWPEPRVPAAWGGSHTEDGWREAFSLLGMACAEPIVNEVEAGIEAVYSAIKTGRLVIFDDEDDFIAQLENYRREVDEEGNVTEIIADKAKNHFMDALRYVVPSIIGRELVIEDDAYMEPAY